MPKTLTAREHWSKAFEYFFEGDRRRTIKEARLAMKLNPNYVRPHWIIGSVYLSTEPVDCEAALKEFRELVRKDPRWPEGHTSLGRTLMRQGRTAEALQSFREVLRLKPNSPWAQIEIGRHLLKRGEYREAVAVLLGKPNPPQFCTMADAHLLIAEFLINWSYDEACAEWEYILTLDETIPAYRVAQIEARKRLQEMESLNPHRARTLAVKSKELKSED
ncbi:MAG TPA: tetratricopeptide repeat protein [Pyrinomonadaceae bacterium]|nr:tetratricopeptide repeat protein [Pyrinomonadaceae bacterium]